MTVRELIEKLRDMPPESVVVAREMDGGFFEVDTDDVRVETKAPYPISPRTGGVYWERPFDGSKGQMVVVIAP